MSELTFYTHPMSRGRTIRWMLEEIGQPYRTELLDYTSTMKAPAYLAINPLGKVPAIRHGDTVVTESAAICAYLVDAFPAAGLAPALTDPKRGEYYRWLFVAAGPLEAAIMDQLLGIEVPDDKKAMVGYCHVTEMLKVLETALSHGDYLLGSQFSAADIYVGALLGWIASLGMLGQSAVFEGYLQRLSSRPAAIRAQQMDDALLGDGHS